MRTKRGCDLLRKLYLCGSITTIACRRSRCLCCDLLRKLYLCGSITTDYQYILDIQRYIELLKENKNEATEGNPTQ